MSSEGSNLIGDLLLDGVNILVRRRLTISSNAVAAAIDVEAEGQRTASISRRPPPPLLSLPTLFLRRNKKRPSDDRRKREGPLDRK